MTTDQSKKLRQQITAHRLHDELMRRMAIVRIGGVKRSVIYKAFQQGPVTPVCQLILEQAQTLLDEHRASVAEAA